MADDRTAAAAALVVFKISWNCIQLDKADYANDAHRFAVKFECDAKLDIEQGLAVRTAKGNRP
ncbi:MAG: hypothetical protein ACON39_09255 [Coraliomargaritaceae bacterium]